MINPKKSSKMQINFLQPAQEGTTLKMLSLNNNKKKLFCEICKENFTNEKKFLEHIKQHVDFVCSLCGEHFRKEKTRDIHEANRFCQGDTNNNNEKEMFMFTEGMNNRGKK